MTNICINKSREHQKWFDFSVIEFYEVDIYYPVALFLSYSECIENVFYIVQSTFIWWNVGYVTMMTMLGLFWMHICADLFANETFLNGC